MRVGPVPPLVLLLGVSISLTAAPAAANVAFPSPDTLPREAAAAADLVVEPRLHGRSGSVRVPVLDAGAEVDVHRSPSSDRGALEYRWLPLYGTRGPAVAGVLLPGARLRAPSEPGFWGLEVVGDVGSGAEVRVLTRVPAARKRDGVLNGYRIGTYRDASDPRYAPPAGFVEVTPENQDVPISRSFRLRNFLTKDQFDVWPKYVALDMRLIDKLELVLQELSDMGIRADRMEVMSGYRTPLYNGPGGNGRAQNSRHTFGDAADVWVDNDGSGWIADLNGDGRRDVDDVHVMLRAVERVEARHPELVGGAGVYLGNSVRGPFIHIDVRGSRARW
jgi:hypothetical protein